MVDKFNVLNVNNGVTRRLIALTKQIRRRHPVNLYPLRKEAFLNRNRNQNKGKSLEQLKNVKINYVSIKDKQEEQAQVYAALDPSGCNR